MSFLQDDVLNAILDNLWGAQAYGLTPPDPWYIGLFEVSPDPDGTGGTEASWAGYARVAITNDLTDWPAAVAGLKSNAALIDFGTAGSGPQDVVSFGFFDHPTDPGPGPLWAVVDLTGAPVTINNGAAVSFPISSIDLTGCV
jgi:hypothetical protein